MFGYSPDEPEQLYCHPIEPGGVTLAYAPDERENLLPGEKTGFRQRSEDGTPYQGQVTFYLEDEDGCCYTFGHKPEYYDALGCTAL